MTRFFFALFMIAFVLQACSPSQKITGSYVNQEALPYEPFKSVCVGALVPDQKVKAKIETQMVELIQRKRKDIKAYTSGQLVSEKLLSQASLSKGEWADVLTKNQVEAMLTIVLQDVKTESRYDPAGKEAYNPSFSYIYYDSYSRYYSFHSNTEAGLPVLETEKTYFVETNFYRVADEKLLWSIQSESFNPESFDVFFDGYSKTLLKELEDKGLILK
ncbi:MAG: hypothetical protein ACK5JD_09030 [Mangrovibacterium sp.]